MRQKRQPSLWTRTAIVLLCFASKPWVREVSSFRPNFDPRFIDRTHSGSKDECCHSLRKPSVAIASVASENEVGISATTKAAPPPFDYRKIPSISDTTPCEVIHTFEGASHSVDPYYHEEEFYFPSSEEWASLPKGDRGGYHIVRQYAVAANDVVSSSECLHHHHSTNLTLQNALTILDPENYPTLTRARKACRKGMVLVHQNPKQQWKSNDDEGNPNSANVHPNATNHFEFQRGTVGDRVQPGDVIGVQMFLGTYRKKQCYPMIEYSRPQFQLEVLYEDDHLAVVNKPAGVAVYSETRTNANNNKTGKRKTIHFVLPFVLTPPKRGTRGGILRRPGIVHRLDKPTSGLLLVAKTKTAMENLKEQFRTRQIQKIYTAIVNGDLMPLQEECQPKEAKKSQTPDEVWNLIDYPVGGKHALTSWKILKRSQSLNARDGILTMIQVRLHTGRYHQIRRHFAWYYFRPLVGDHLYAGLLQAHHFRKKGLFLSSNGISFLHPIQDDDPNAEPRRVEVTIDVPKKFDKLMRAEESWAMHHSKKEIS